MELRPDGLLRLERETGWAVIDPEGIVAVVWDSEPESFGGPIPLTGSAARSLASGLTQV